MPKIQSELERLANVVLKNPNRCLSEIRYQYSICYWYSFHKSSYLQRPCKEWRLYQWKKRNIIPRTDLRYCFLLSLITAALASSILKNAESKIRVYLAIMVFGQNNRISSNCKSIFGNFDVGHASFWKSFTMSIRAR